MLQQMDLESIILHVKATHKRSNIIQLHFNEVSRIVRLIDRLRRDENKSLFDGYTVSFIFLSIDWLILLYALSFLYIITLIYS